MKSLIQPSHRAFGRLIRHPLPAAALRGLLLGVLALGGAGSLNAETAPWIEMEEVEAWTGRVPVTVSNDHRVALKDAPVAIPIADLSLPAKALSPGSLMVADPETAKMPPFQADDLDGDGVMDELVFLATLQPGERRVWQVYFAEKGRAWPRQKRYTAALASPAWESELAGFRSYGALFVDLFVRRADRPGLMLAHFYDAANQQIYNYHRESDLGIDTLHIGKTAGLAGVLVRQGSETFIPYSARFSSKVIVSGPVRSIVRMEQEPWESPAGTFKVTRTATIYAHHAETRLDDRVEVLRVNDPKARYGIGLRKVDGMKLAASEKTGLLTQWHHQSPEIGEAGLAIWIPPAQGWNREDDGDNTYAVFQAPLEAGKPLETRAWVWGAWKGGGGVSSFEAFQEMGAEIVAQQVPLTGRAGTFEPAPRP